MRDITSKRGLGKGVSALPGLDLGKIFTEGFKRRDTEADRWHKEDPDNWKYHASGVTGCPRAQLLKRLGHDHDGITLGAALTFEVGHAYHALLEDFATAYEAVEPRFKVLAVEAGGTHPRLPLKARCDLLFTWDGEPILADLKTEAPQAAARRREAQAKFGYPYPYRWENQMQIAAQAIVIESLMKMPVTINQGRLLYINKVNMQVDQVPCEVSSDARLTVMRALEAHEKVYQSWNEFGLLPARLQAVDDVWQCRPRSDTDPRGQWCSCRSTCFAVENVL